MTDKQRRIVEEYAAIAGTALADRIDEFDSIMGFSIGGMGETFEFVRGAGKDDLMELCLMFVELQRYIGKAVALGSGELCAALSILWFAITKKLEESDVVEAANEAAARSFLRSSVN